MIGTPKHNHFDPATLRHTIQNNRTIFSTYNISRLRELLRYLPKEKTEMFYIIPFLLHINSQKWPGFVDDNLTPYGICGFYDSGFWKLAKRKLDVRDEGITAFVSKVFYIKGVYLMGSAGSLGQTDYSDFDYWVVVDAKKMGSTEKGLLRKKLRLIEQWALDEFRQHMTFFVLDADQVRRNDFSGLAEEGFCITQRTILKEEFYRTFIFIAGQIPWWVVFPSGLTDQDYIEWVDTIVGSSKDVFCSDDYVDLGNINRIEKEECLGSVLWQFCKAQSDPVKALIKASLILYHYYFQEDQGLLCAVTKQKMSATQLDSHLLDPYALTFEKILYFYNETRDIEGLDLIKECIYLRISGYPAPRQSTQESPKKMLMDRYLREWLWTEKKIKRLLSYPSWAESEKLRFEESIRKKLWGLYRQLLLMNQAPLQCHGKRLEDLAALRNKASAQLKKKRGKIPWASTFLRSKKEKHPLFIAYRRQCWGIYDDSTANMDVEKKMLYSAPELLHLLGWVVLNGLFEDLETLPFRQVQRTIPTYRAKELLVALQDHFDVHKETASFRMPEPKWRKMFIVLDPSRQQDDAFCSADLLILNTWGEVIFDVIDLQPFDNKLLKYNEIAKNIWQRCEGVLADGFYCLFDLRTVMDLTAEKTIDDLLAKFHQSGETRNGLNKEPGQVETASDEPSKSGILIDLF